MLRTAMLITGVTIPLEAAADVAGTTRASLARMLHRPHTSAPVSTEKS